MAPGAYENRITMRPQQYLRRIFVDTASPSPAAMLANIDVLGSSQIMFGTDAPPLGTPLAEVLDGIRSLPLSESEIDGILGGTARRVFKLD